MEGTLSDHSQESKSSSFELFDDDPSGLAAMLDYIDGSRLEHAKARNEPKDSGRGLLFYAELFVLADKYEVPRLRDDVLQVFKPSLLAVWHKQNFYAAINCIYAMPRGSYFDEFRKVVRSLDDSQLEGFMEDDDFKELVQAFALLSSDILSRCVFASSANSGHKLSCRACRATFFWSKTRREISVFRARYMWLHCPFCGKQDGVESQVEAVESFGSRGFSL